MHPINSYVTVDSAYPYIIRGTNQGTDTGLLWANPQSPKIGASAGGTGRTGGLALGGFSLHNRSGSTIVVGIGVRIPNYLWKAGQWTNATTTFTDDTTDAQDSGSDDFALETAGTDNNGYVILSRVKFNAVSINVTTDSVKGTTVARAVRFSDSAGTSWATAPSNLFIQSGSADDYGTGEKVVVFAPPVDWGKSSSLATSLPDGYYAMNVRATDAPDTTAALAKAIEIFRVYYLKEAVADNASIDYDFGAKDFAMAWDATEGWVGDGLAAVFGTANDQNRVSALVRAL